MADLSMIHDDCLDDPDEGFDQGDCLIMEDVSSLPPLMRVKKYGRSGNPSLRQMAVRIVIDILKSVPPCVLLKDLTDIMEVLTILLEESILDAEMQNEIRSNLRSVVSDVLIPLVMRKIGTNDMVVDRRTQAALVQLIEQNFISKAQIEIQVCPSILALSKGETEEDLNANAGAITLMGKLAPHLGRDDMERIFLKRFTELCASPMLLLRKICAGNFGDFCFVVGKESLEKTLLPCYITLCGDEVFGVRQACAEVITYVSCACSLGIRRELLAPAFIKLLQDENRWVRTAAYQSLGPFISTFADPDVTSMAYNKYGELVLTNKNGQEFVMQCTRSLTLSDKCLSTMDQRNWTDIFNTGDLDISESDRAEKDEWLNGDLLDYQDHLENEDGSNKTNVIDNESCDNIVTEALNNLTDELNNLNVFDSDDILNKNSRVVSQLTNVNLEENNFSNKDLNHNDNKVNNGGVLDDDLHLFNSNVYWYISPDMPLDPSIIAGKEPSRSVTTNLIDKDNFSMPSNNGSSNGNAIIETEETEKHKEIPISNLDVANECETSMDSTLSLEENCENLLENAKLKKSTVNEQTIVPQELIQHFISMTDSDLLLHVDAEMSYYCAYSLPAVALTLGSKNWHILKGTVDYLASDLQYKVRKTLASSLHELAVILGPGLATEKLAPLFEGFLKDLDEVRIGVLEHLSEFFELIDPAKTNTYLPRLGEFLKTDTESNWRFREELGRQLVRVVPLFKPADTAKYIGGGIAIELLCDKVAAVRQVALQLVTKILAHISKEVTLTSTLLMRLSERFAHSKKWKRRQTFCLLCEEILKEQCLSPARFASDLMPHLLDLSWDPVVNVRLVVARCLAVHIITNKYFTNSDNEHCDGLEIVLRRLQADKDRDVRASASFVSS